MVWFWGGGERGVVRTGVWGEREERREVRREGSGWWVRGELERRWESSSISPSVRALDMSGYIQMGTPSLKTGLWVDAQ